MGHEQKAIDRHIDIAQPRLVAGGRDDLGQLVRHTGPEQHQPPLGDQNFLAINQIKHRGVGQEITLDMAVPMRQRHHLRLEQPDAEPAKGPGRVVEMAFGRRGGVAGAAGRRWGQPCPAFRNRFGPFGDRRSLRQGERRGGGGHRGQTFVPILSFRKRMSENDIAVKPGAAHSRGKVDDRGIQIPA